MRVYGGRRLLNPPGSHSTGAIVAEVASTARWKHGCDSEGKPLTRDEIWRAEPDYVMFQVSDCTRSVQLSIGWSSAHERRMSLAKVDSMLGVLARFREGLVEEQARYVERVKTIPRR